MSVTVVTKENFQTEVLGASAPVLVEFWAPWCVYCRRLAPVLDRMAQNGTRVAKIDIDSQPELADQFGVDAVPSLFLFRSGEHSDKLVAPASQAQIEEWVLTQGKS